MANDNVADPSKLFDVKLSGERSHTLGSYDNGSAAYELLYMAMMTHDPQKSIDDMVTKLTTELVSINDLALFIYNNKQFDDHKKIHMEAADQNRRIANNTHSVIKCRKCGSDKTKTVTIQDRGLDEPSTVHVSCTKCGARYKQAE
jgi:DNA-directed RNA polymerase subunit M/transcription elongation factor TFIIS